MSIPTGLYGNFALTNTEIDARVGKAIGAYLLGNGIDDQGSLRVRYPGRSDSDLNGRLKQWVGSYRWFQYGHLPTMQAAFNKECELYHAFGGDHGSLDNSVHPAKPAGMNCKCPVCGA